MSATLTKKTRKPVTLDHPASPPQAALASKKTNLELSAPALGALKRLKELHGVSKTFAIERGLIMLEQRLNTQARGL